MCKGMLGNFIHNDITLRISSFIMKLGVHFPPTAKHDQAIFQKSTSVWKFLLLNCNFNFAIYNLWSQEFHLNSMAFKKLSAQAIYGLSFSAYWVTTSSISGSDLNVPGITVPQSSPYNSDCFTCSLFLALLLRSRSPTWYSSISLLALSPAFADRRLHRV